MKKLLTVMVILCVGSVIYSNSNPNSLQTDCSWNVFESNSTEDDWFLCIRSTNRCNFAIKVRVKYKEAYKARYCDDKWSYNTETEEFYLPANKSNYPLIGNCGPTYDSCTRRYYLISAIEVVDED